MSNTTVESTQSKPDATTSSSSIIGQGGYGCVYRPPLQCGDRDDIDYEGKVSKLMPKKAAIEELDEFKAIDRIDPDRTFHLGKPDMCKPKESDIPLFKNCPPLSKKNMPLSTSPEAYRLLVMPDGGMDLVKFFGEKEFTSYFQRYPTTGVRNFIDAVEDLLVGLLAMQENGICHHDIKMPNVVILIDPDTGKLKLRLIDFGIMTTFEQIKTLSNNDENPFSIFFYNFPLTNALTDYSNYEEYQSLNRSELLHSISTNAERPINTFVSYTGEDKTKIVREFVDWFLDLQATFRDDDDFTQTQGYEAFLDYAVRRIDIFGMGLVLTHAFRNMRRHFPNTGLYDDCRSFALRMTRYNTTVDMNDILSEYRSKFLVKSGGGSPEFDPYADPSDAQGNPLRWPKKGGKMSNRKRKTHKKHKTNKKTHKRRKSKRRN